MAAFFKAHLAYENGLTKRIVWDPHLPLFDCLIDPDLAATVRNEAPDFINYLKARDRDSNMSRLHLMFEWALSDSPNADLQKRGTPAHRAMLAKFRFFQPNRNASTVLAYPSRSIWALVEETRLSGPQSLHARLLLFLSEPLSKNPIFAGHFQRIIQWFFRASNRASDWLTDTGCAKLIEFCLENVNILAYQELLTRIITDFSTASLAGPGERIDFLRKILTAAARRTIEVYRTFWQGSAESLRCSMSSLVTSQRSQCLAVRQNPVQYLPLNWQGHEIPCAQWLVASGPAIQIPKCQLTPYVQRRITELHPTASAVQDLPLTKLQAYLLLSCIFAMICESPYVLKDLQTRDGDKFPLLDLLLLCGVLADPTSMVSHQAFRLLKSAIYGITPEQMDPIPGVCEESLVAKLVDEYATSFTFTEPPTPQMIAAFPLFWNHNYKDLALASWEPKKFPLYTDEGKLDEGRPAFLWERPRGVTPLERFAGWLLDEPALSDAFNYQIMAALKFASQRAEKLRGQPSADWGTWFEKVMTADLVTFDFLRAPARLAAGTVVGFAKDILLNLASGRTVSLTDPMLGTLPGDTVFRLGKATLFKFMEGTEFRLQKDTRVSFATGSGSQRGKPVLFKLAEGALVTFCEKVGLTLPVCPAKGKPNESSSGSKSSRVPLNGFVHEVAVFSTNSDDYVATTFKSGLVDQAAHIGDDVALATLHYNHLMADFDKRTRLEPEAGSNEDGAVNRPRSPPGEPSAGLAALRTSMRLQ
jgi:hypothetical protein